MSVGRSLAMVASVTAIAIALAAVALSWFASERFAAAVRTDLAERARSVNALVERELREGLERRVERIADDAPFASYVQASVGEEGVLDAESLRDLLEERSEQYRVSRLAVLDLNGRPLVATDARLQRRAELAQHPAVRESVRNARLGTGLIADEDGFDLLAVVPIASGGAIVAHLAGTSRVDAEHARRLAEALGAPVALASSAFGANRRLVLVEGDSPEDWAVRLADPRPDALLRAPLFGDASGPTLLVATDGPGARAGWLMRAGGVLAALAATVGIAIVALWTWLSVLRPLANLPSALRRIPAGDYHVDLPIRGGAFACEVLGGLERLMVWLRSQR
jgi:HAMP domain-containing protein